jgi:hypothetical protein
MPREPPGSEPFSLAEAKRTAAVAAHFEVAPGKDVHSDQSVEGKAVNQFKAAHVIENKGEARLG